MNITCKYIIFQAVIIFPFILGYLINNRFSFPVSGIKKIIRINLYFLEPLIVLWSIWGLNLTRDLIILPFVGLTLVYSGKLIGEYFSKFLNLDKKGKASFIISSSLTNHGGTMGGFICYIFLGEKALALSFIFLLYFAFYTYVYIFSYAQLVSKDTIFEFKNSLKYIFKLHNMPFFAALAALVLNSIDFKRPAVDFSVDTIILFSIGLAYFALGLTFEFHKVKGAWKENIFLIFTKFLIIPVIALIITWFLPLSNDIKMVILIESFMPVAVYSVVASVFFDLDGKLSSALFVVNTVVFLFAVLPLLLIFFKFFV